MAKISPNRKDYLIEEREALKRRPQNNLAAWFPLLASLDVPVPRTRIVYAYHEIGRAHV